MTTMIGIAIAADAVRAISVRRGAVQWALQTERKESSRLAEDLNSLLDKAPITKWSRARVTAAVGPASAQTKRLSGLPPVRDAAALSRIVRESAGRFFLRHAAPIEISGVRIQGESVWVAALERQVIEAIEQCCARRKLRLSSISPTMVVLPLAIRSRRIKWSDGNQFTDANYDERWLLESIVRGVAGEDEHVRSAVAAPLSILGDGAWQFADAYGAAVSSIGEPIAWRTSRRRGSHRLSRTEHAAALTAFIAALVAFALPAVGDALTIRRANDWLARFGTRSMNAAADRAEVEKMTSALREVASFAQARHSSVLLLGDIARALPNAAVMTSLHVDTIAGTASIVAPRIAAALTALEHVRSISGVEIIGPVTKEIASGREVERASVHFRLNSQETGAK